MAAAAAAEIVLKVASPRYLNLALVCVIWVAFYPVARLNPKKPWWLHWVEGLFVLAGFWLVSLM